MHRYIYTILLSITLLSTTAQKAFAAAEEKKETEMSTLNPMKPAAVRSSRGSDSSDEIGSPTGSTKGTRVHKDDLLSVSQFKKLFDGAKEITGLEDLDPETKRAIFILFHRDVKNKKTTTQGWAEFVYTWGGLASGTSVTWNVFGREVLLGQLGWLDGGYDAYGPATPPDRMAGMIILNLHTFPSLYLFNWGQMSEDAHDITSQWKYNRPYQWSDDACSNALHIPSRILHTLNETFVRPSMPYTPHWSQSVVVPMAWAYWTLNTIPEMSAIIPVLEQTGNWWTGISVPMAILQRIGAQKRRTRKTMVKFYSKTAEWGADEKTNSLRKELLDALDNTSRRIRNYRLSKDEKTADYIRTLFLSIFRKEMKEGRSKNTTNPSLILTSRSAVLPRIDIPTAEEVLTAEGILSVFYGVGGSHPRGSIDTEYVEPTVRYITGWAGAAIGLWGSIAPGIIMDVALQGGFTFLGADSETSAILSKLISVPIGLAGGAGRANAMREYATRLYDAFTGQRHYIDSGEPNDFFTDVVFGEQEGKVLVTNYLEGLWWDGLLYGALGVAALDTAGISLPEAGALLIPTIVAQGAFGAGETLDDIETAAHGLQKLRKSKRYTDCCNAILDTIFCCCRGSRRCTTEEHLKGPSVKELEQSIHSYRVLRAIAKEKEGIQYAPSTVVREKHKLFIENNPLLEGGFAADEESAGAGAAAVLPVTGALPAGTPARRSDRSIRLLSSLDDAILKEEMEEDEIIVPYTNPFSCLTRIFGW